MNAWSILLRHQLRLVLLYTLSFHVQSNQNLASLNLLIKLPQAKNIDDVNDNLEWMRDCPSDKRANEWSGKACLADQEDDYCEKQDFCQVFYQNCWRVSNVSTHKRHYHTKCGNHYSWKRRPALICPSVMTHDISYQNMKLYQIESRFPSLKRDQNPALHESQHTWLSRIIDETSWLKRKLISIMKSSSWKRVVAFTWVLKRSREDC